MSTGKDNINRIFKSKDNFDYNSNFLVKILIGVVTIIIVSVFLPSYKNIESNYEVGTIWSSEDLIAPFPFPIYRDETDYEIEKKEAIKNVTTVFLERDMSRGEIADSVSAFFSLLDKILSKSGRDNFRKLKETSQVELSENQWQSVIKYFTGEVKSSPNVSYVTFKNSLKQFILDFTRFKIINLDKSAVQRKEIAVKRNGDKHQILEDIDKIYDIKQINIIYRNRFTPILKDTSIVYIFEKVVDELIPENLVYSKELTDLEIQNKIEQIPKTIGLVKENERIISKHDPITKVTKLKLDSFKKVRLENMGMQDYFAQFIGKLLTILILFTALVFFLFYIRNGIYRDNLKLTLIASLIIIECFIAFLSLTIKINAPVELLIFVPVASILLTIIFDSRLSFFTTVIICFLVAAVRGGDFTIILVSFAGSVLAIFSVRDIKNRSQIFRSFFFVLIGYSISILAIALDRSQDLSKLSINLLFGTVNSVMSPVIAYGMLIFYEKVFGITTDLTLLELADFNQPLLRELSTKAPGTFHHSIVMGNLAEEAAAAIGANRIMARVGCYYHDIGKITKPSFFVENQMESVNRHEVLNPSMSAKIIIAHVKNGIELAKKYKIPQGIIDFIPMHHGTTLVSYFYNKAKGSIDENKEDLSDYIYRYPGPKPQTKETGIAMLADTVEAATKAIEDPTPKKLEDKIDGVIKNRFIEGELDECELTLKDLTKIKKAFLKILVGIHHQRIKYPEETSKDD